jgi:hypothetical protein
MPEMPINHVAPMPDAQVIRLLWRGSCGCLSCPFPEHQLLQLVKVDVDDRRRRTAMILAPDLVETAAALADESARSYVKAFMSAS